MTNPIKSYIREVWIYYNLSGSKNSKQKKARKDLESIVKKLKYAEKKIKKVDDAMKIVKDLEKILDKYFKTKDFQIKPYH